MKKKLIIGLSLFFLFILVFFLFIKLGTRPVNKKDEKVVIFTVNPGESRSSIIKRLSNKDNNLVRSKLAGNLYINLRRDYNIQAGTYALSRKMSLKDILKKFDKGEIVDLRKTTRLTFVPGKRITDYADTIAKFISKQENNSSVTADAVIKEISDTEYVKTLIDKYWFLTDEVLDSEIYYPLEGYLFPETYEFYEDASINDIVTKMLDTTSAKLTPLKEDIEKSNHTVHQILSAAGIIEKEANTEDDRRKVSQVIYKRLELGMNLGMDVTAYYAAKADLKDDYMYAWNFLKSKYNTRNKDNIGLPVGPICNPSLSSIKAALNPYNSNYVYFYADMKTGKVYFSEDYAGFIQIQKDLGVK